MLISALFEECNVSSSSILSQGHFGHVNMPFNLINSQVQTVLYSTSGLYFSGETTKHTVRCRGETPSSGVYVATCYTCGKITD